mgnify:CR=1 FL=1
MATNSDDIRPSPEAMLKLAQAEEVTAELGRLKIFLGYAAGVGKTYAMLEAARQRKYDGRDVVAGYVESHGRSETDTLLDGLEVLPRKEVLYMGVALQEMDLDAILTRRPQIVLVDELAHSNAPGSRHEKRWQDVEELLAAGIDVHTTVNIQHFESLKDVVAQITGVTVRETVPDRLLDLAFEIKLIDITPEDLLQRLHEGKIYIADQAAKAIEKFFRPGNLMALRELSLRRTAARVDEQMRAYMETKSIAGPWPTAERLLVCVSGSPYSEKLIRSTCRLAEELKAQWFTVYIETPADGRHLRENREHIWRDLRLAESLGGQVASITATDITDAVMEYATRHNITKIVMGKPTRRHWRKILQTPIVDRIIRRSGAIDVVIVSFEANKPAGAAAVHRSHSPFELRGYAASLALVLAATALCELLRPFLAPTNMVMFYLLAVVVAALRLSRKPAIATAFLGVLAFDFFFIPPRLTFAVADTEYLLTFLGLFVVGVVISNLVARSKERAEVMRNREVQTASLYYLSRDLAASANIETVLKAVLRNVEEALNAQVVIMLPEGERLDILATSDGLTLDIKEQAVADWAFRNSHPAGRATDTLVSADLIYLPLQTPASVLGVMGVKLESPQAYHSQENRRLLDAFATQAAMAMERLRFSRQAEQAQILQARENLERALLNSISHDLRTPLVTISGVLDSILADDQEYDPQQQKTMISLASEEASRLNRFVSSLLDMTRLEAGVLSPRFMLCEVEEIIGCAIGAIKSRIGENRIVTNVESNLPPVSADLVLLTQALVNLLDNALKYSPPSADIGLSALLHDTWIVIEVTDCGPGVPAGEEKRIFDKFHQVKVPEAAEGTGLGLSIAKGIIEAHHGTISASNRPQGGLNVQVMLPADLTSFNGGNYEH